MGARISIRKDLWDSGQIREWANLKGKKIGVASVSGMTQLLAPWLQRANLTPKDVDLVALGYPDMLTALTNKSIDAAVLAEPILTKATDGGVAVRYTDLLDMDPPPTTGLVYISPKFAENTEGVNRLVLAYIKGLRDYNDAFAKNKGKKEIVDILSKGTGIDVSLFDRMEVPGFDPDGYVDKRALDWTIKYWVSTGELKEAFDVDKLVDNRYADNAVQKLGKYPR